MDLTHSSPLPSPRPAGLQLFVNGEVQKVNAATLADLLSELDFEGDWLATAHNGELITASERARCLLQSGDRIEILSPMQGG